jgi:endoglucanase
MKASLAILATLAAQASATIYFAGVAESSGEFGAWSQDKVKGTGLPGRFGVDYAFIDQKGVDIHVDRNGVSPTGSSHFM